MRFLESRGLRRRRQQEGDGVLPQEQEECRAHRPFRRVRPPTSAAAATAPKALRYSEPSEPQVAVEEQRQTDFVDCHGRLFGRSVQCRLLRFVFRGDEIGYRHITFLPNKNTSRFCREVFCILSFFYSSQSLYLHLPYISHLINLPCDAETPQEKVIHYLFVKIITKN